MSCTSNRMASRLLRAVEHRSTYLPEEAVTKKLMLVEPCGVRCQSSQSPMS